MRRRKFITLFGVAAATWPFVAHAQQSKKIPHLCFLTFDPGTLQSRSPRFDAFFDSLRELGYVNGQTISIDYLSADGLDERYPALVSECLRLKGGHYRRKDDTRGSGCEGSNPHGPDCHDRAFGKDRSPQVKELNLFALPFNAILSAKGYVWFWPKIAAALTSKHHWLIIACDSCGTVVDLDLRVKPRDPEASIRTALRGAQCPRCNGHGRPRIIALARHPSM